MPRKAPHLVSIATPAPTVRLITLANRQLRNAMTAELTTAWVDAIEDIKRDSEVRAVVVTGDGSTFCSGADLSWLDQTGIGDLTPDHLRERMLPFYRAWLAPRELSVPVIAAMNGPAIGAGVALALACDLRYGMPSATFSTPFIRVGTYGGMGAGKLLAEAVGLPRAREMLFTCREVGAAEALNWGLLNGIAEDVVATAVEVADGIARSAPIATRLTKSGVNQLSDSLGTALEWDALAQPLTMATEDIHEGINAIRERRSPAFKGR